VQPDHGSVWSYPALRASTKIILRRAYSAEELFEWNCDLCEVPYTPKTVYPDIMGMEGAICETCLDYLHSRHPKIFPSTERLHELQAAYPTAMFKSDVDVMKLEEEDLDEASRLHEACLLWTRESEGIDAGERVGPY
jgi:hypothetical protein